MEEFQIYGENSNTVNANVYYVKMQHWYWNVGCLYYCKLNKISLLQIYLQYISNILHSYRLFHSLLTENLKPFGQQLGCFHRNLLFVFINV